MEQLTRTEAVKKMRETAGKIFSARFKKRTNGEDRLIVCRTGVRRGVTGAGRGFDPEEKGLFPVCDMAKTDPDETPAYRMIDLNTLYELTIDGERYEVVH